MNFFRLKRLTRVSLVMALSGIAISAQGIVSPKSIEPIVIAEHNKWYDLAVKPVNFQSNTQVKRQVDELNIEIDTSGVVFGYDLDNIAYIKPGGHMKMSSDNGFGNIVLEIYASESGEIGFDYRINNHPVKHQRAAQQFMAEVLDKVLDDGVHDWRVHSLKHLAERKPVDLMSKNSSKAISDEKLRAVVNNHQGIYSHQDMALASELLNAQDWRNNGNNIWSFGDNQDKTPYKPAVIASNANFASLDKHGNLNIYYFPENAQMQNFEFNLNNDILMSTFLSATGSHYQAGQTETELVDFLIRVHLQRDASQLNWMDV